MGLGYHEEVLENAKHPPILDYSFQSRLLQEASVLQQRPIIGCNIYQSDPPFWTRHTFGVSQEFCGIWERKLGSKQFGNLQKYVISKLRETLGVGVLQQLPLRWVVSSLELFCVTAEVAHYTLKVQRAGFWTKAEVIALGWLLFCKRYGWK